MTDLHPGRARPSIGISTFVASLARTVEVATAGDRAGLDTAWTGEFNDCSAIVALAEMAYHTSTCRIGSSIAYAVGRSPLVLANEARALDELSNGRLVLGLGRGTKGMRRVGTANGIPRRPQRAWRSSSRCSARSGIFTKDPSSTRAASTRWTSPPRPRSRRPCESASR